MSKENKIKILAALPVIIAASNSIPSGFSKAADFDWSESKISTDNLGRPLLNGKLMKGAAHYSPAMIDDGTNVLCSNSGCK